MSDRKQMPEPMFTPAIALPIIEPSATEKAAIAGLKFNTPEQTAATVKRLEDEARESHRERANAYGFTSDPSDEATIVQSR
jgi:hypothetical protein